VTQECLDQTKLKFADGTDRFILGYDDKGEPGKVDLKVILPAGVTCQYCVLQWWWKSNINNNGCGLDAGCGEQEQYRNCADIAIQATG
jgi:hypothetical protein